MLDWDKLRIFQAVAQAKSFTKAGEQLHLSQSVISRHIQSLEESMNVTLFHRHAKGLVLTEQGEILWKATQDIFIRLSAAENALLESRERPRGPLRITAPTAFGTVWLTPRLDEFVELYPDIDVTLIVDNRELDLSMREADVAIRMKKPTQQELTYRTLTTFHNGIFASKAYLARYGMPQAIEDLTKHRIIAYETASNLPFADVNWLPEKIGEHRTRIALRVNSLTAMVLAVQQGVGIAALPSYLAQGKEEIVRVLPGVGGPDTEAYFVYASELRQSKRINVFREFLLRKIADWQF